MAFSKAVPIVLDDMRWQAVADRDPRFNGTFVYGVRSTGIYCRPSCSSRRPKRENVIFFATIDEAKLQGFRECRRCHADAQIIIDPRIDLTLRACRLLESSVETPLSLEGLSNRLGLSPHHLQRTFKSIVGITPKQYSAWLRIKQFKTSVRNGEGVTESLYDAGYGSSSRLYETARSRLGMTPATYRRGGQGMSISFTVADSHLGRMLVARTSLGICSVAFGKDDNELTASLKAEYPKAAIKEDKSGLGEWVKQLLDHLDGSQRRLELPLDVQATSFQMRIWEELRRIPFGETRSYAQIAKSIGQPSSTRAVARACASNPVALVNPCHRVVRSDGELSGYRWGVDRKRKLLEREKEKKEVGS